MNGESVCTEEPDHEITRLLHEWSTGNDDAYRQLIPLVYENLRRIADGVNVQSGFPATQSTGIVHELYLKLVDTASRNYESRVHFFSAAARAMRQILIDRSRREMAEKRGGTVEHTAWDDANIAARTQPAQVLALDEALEILARQDAGLAALIDLRHFGGFTLEEIADLRQVSPETVRRHLRLAESWLAAHLRSDQGT